MADFVGDYSEASLYEGDADGYSYCLAHDDEYVDDNSGYCVRSTSDDDYEFDEDHGNDNDRYHDDDYDYDYGDDNSGYCVSPTSDDNYEYDDDDDEDHGNNDNDNDSDSDIDEVFYFRGPTYDDGYEDLTINNLSNAFDLVELVDEVGSTGYGYHDWTDDLFDDWGLSLSDYECSEFDANFSDFDFL